MTEQPQLIRNAGQCLLCMDIIESKHRHDFVRCSCGKCFVDGGLDYSRRGAPMWEVFKDLCVYEDAPMRQIEVFEDEYVPGSWRVEHFTDDNYFLTTFLGDDAEKRARAYAKSVGG